MSELEPCACWTEIWSPHDGHCCFHPDSPDDCHDAEMAIRGAVEASRHGRGTNGLGGPLMERRYWLTDLGWAAVGGRSA